ncbi:MAG: hypothetical protein GC208_10335 [Alphaproteobacteria bacterium]|nr:hypothetical protein [Alphaproteobacteria bacterium]
MSRLPDSNREDRARLMRGAVLLACYQAYPNSLFVETIDYLLEEFELSEEELGKDLHWMKELGLLEMGQSRVIGLKMEKIKLTTKGYALAKRIDPKHPVMPEVD